MPLKRSNVSKASRFARFEETKRDASSKLAHSVLLGFLPDAKTLKPKDTWWDIRPEWAVRAIGVLGFKDVKIIYHTQSYEGREIELYTIVGKRTHGNVVSY